MFNAIEKYGPNVVTSSVFLKESGSRDHFIKYLDFHTLAINSILNNNNNQNKQNQTSECTNIMRVKQNMSMAWIWPEVHRFELSSATLKNACYYSVKKTHKILEHMSNYTNAMCFSDN